MSWRFYGKIGKVMKCFITFLVLMISLSFLFGVPTQADVFGKGDVQESVEIEPEFEVEERTEEEEQVAVTAVQEIVPTGITVTGNVAEVDDWFGFLVAMMTPSVTEIRLLESISSPSGSAGEGYDDFAGNGYAASYKDQTRTNYVATVWPAKGSNNSSGNQVTLWLKANNIGRTVKIVGAKDNIEMDFGAITIGFDETTGSTVGAWNITWENLTIYSGNDYGFVNYRELTEANQKNSTMTFHNVTYYGSEMAETPYSEIILSGNTNLIQASSFTSEVRGQSWNINSTNQTNLQAQKLTIAEDAVVTMSVLNVNNIGLTNNNNILTIGTNATLDISKSSSGATNLISMNGTLTAQNQKISTWNGNNTHVWQPIYDLTMTYSGTTITRPIAAKSISQIRLTTPTDFAQNFTTNQQRVRFEPVPQARLDEVNDSNLSITGTTEVGGYVRITSDKGTITNTLTSSVTDTSATYFAGKDTAQYTDNFTLQADASTGNFTYTLLSGTLALGTNTFTIFTYLNGMENQKTVTIQADGTITANDVATDMNTLVTADDLNNYLLTESGATANITINGVTTDVTSNMQVTDDGGLANDLETITGGIHTYTVTIVATSQLQNPLTTTFEVTVDAGELSFKAIPTSIDFGSDHQIAADLAPFSVLAVDTDFITEDSRYKSSGWELRATADTILTPVNQTNTEPIPATFIYQKLKGGDLVEMILGEDEVIIHDMSDFQGNEANITATWSDTSGLFLQISPGDARVGQYTGGITWKLVDGVGN